MNVKLQAETEFDKNITTLANVQAKCRFYRMKGVCKAGDCTACKTKKYYDACYDAMAMCDKLSVDDKATTVYYNLKHNYAATMRGQRAYNSFVGWLIIVAIFVVIAISQGV